MHNTRRTHTTRRLSHRDVYRSKDDPLSLGTLLKRSAISTALTLLGAIICIALISFAALSLEDPMSAAIPSSICLLCLTSAACGSVSAKMTPSAPFASGLLSGLILEAFILAISLFIAHKGMILSPLVRGALFFAMIPLSALGALIGKHLSKSGRRSIVRR